MPKGTGQVGTNLPQHEHSTKFLLPSKTTLKMIIITFEDQMDTLNNDFQVKLLFGFRGSEDHIMHLMGCDTYLSVITFFCLCHFQSAEVFFYIFLKCSWLLKIRN